MDVKPWEHRLLRKPVPYQKAIKASRIYNATISSIIEGTTDWTLDDGYRNVISTIAMTLDGVMRNRIGKDAEDLVKRKMRDWLQDNDLIIRDFSTKKYVIQNGIVVVYGSEPDISFYNSAGALLATIEVKGGTDPAGALERLGSALKSFDQTPANSAKILVAGVITTAMQARINDLAIKAFLLDDLFKDGGWGDFTNEVFHHVLRVT